MVITITIDFRKKSCYVLSTQIAITVIYTYNMFVLFCACDVMNGLSVKKIKIYTQKKYPPKKKVCKKKYFPQICKITSVKICITFLHFFSPCKFHTEIK